jgi:hypothetical protein
LSVWRQSITTSGPNSSETKTTATSSKARTVMPSCLLAPLRICHMAYAIKEACRN